MFVERRCGGRYRQAEVRAMRRTVLDIDLLIGEAPA
jgi:hypothetical protein